jgi:hypothetical protein
MGLGCRIRATALPRKYCGAGPRPAAASQAAQPWTVETASRLFSSPWVKGLLHNVSVVLFCQPAGNDADENKGPRSVFSGVPNATPCSWGTCCVRIDEYGAAPIAWSPDGKTLAMAGGHDASNGWVVKLINVTSGVPVGVLAGHTAMVNSLAWSPDGGRIASGGWDETVRIWEVKDSLLAARWPVQRGRARRLQFPIPALTPVPYCNLLKSGGKRHARSKIGTKPVQNRYKLDIYPRIT